jgi:hypothetical protein
MRAIIIAAGLENCGPLEDVQKAAGMATRAGRPAPVQPDRRDELLRH